MAHGNKMHIDSLSNHTRVTSVPHIQNVKIRYFVIMICLVMSFQTFQYFPGMAMVKEIWLLVMLLFLAVPYFAWKVANDFRTSAYELYILILMALIPILSGMAALNEFQQPLLYGTLAQRNMLLGTLALMTIYAVRKNIIRIADIEKSLLVLSWGTLVLYVLMNAFLNPVDFLGDKGGFVGGGGVSEASFKFRTEFIVFGFMYYALIGYRSRKIRPWLLTTPFILFLIFVGGGRSLLVSIFASLLFFIWRWGTLSRLIVFMPKLLFFLMFSIVIMYATNAEYIGNLLDKFDSAITVVLTGDETNDASANARIIETAIALPYIEKHWVMGNGDISNQWGGGYEGVLGGYFYPSDIGIFGVMYMYGLLGMLLFLAQFQFAFRYSKMIARYNIQTPLIDATKGYLLYFAIHSLVTGRFAHYSEVSLFFIALLGCVTYVGRKYKSCNVVEYSKVMT